MFARFPAIGFVFLAAHVLVKLFSIRRKLGIGLLGCQEIGVDRLQAGTQDLGLLVERDVHEVHVHVQISVEGRIVSTFDVRQVQATPFHVFLRKMPHIADGIAVQCEDAIVIAHGQRINAAHLVVVEQNRNASTAYPILARRHAR